jgi:hypothetical protein
MLVNRVAPLEPGKLHQWPMVLSTSAWIMAPYRATTSISTAAPSGKPAAWIVVRAG